MVKLSVIYIILIILTLVPFSYSVDFAYNRLFDGANININETNNITNIFNNITIDATGLNLNNLTDVDVPSPSDGDSLVWDNSLMKWVAEFVISRWNIDLSNGYLYNNSDTLFFNETKLNNTGPFPLISLWR